MPTPPSAVTSIRLRPDPFGFYGATGSQIGGIGSAAEPPHGTFAFHTPYLPFAAGPVAAAVLLEGLKATVGDLVVEVNLLPESAEPPVRQIAKVKLALAELARDGGLVRLNFEATEGASYAIQGLVSEESDASAHAIDIAVDCADLSDMIQHKVRQARRSFLLDEDGRIPSSCPALISDAPATMARPATQMCTASQFDEPAYRRWLDVLGEPARFHRKQWEVIYILQALDRAGMLRSGRRGLGFAVGHEALPAIMAARGVTVVATDLPEQHGSTRLWRTTDQHGCLEALRYPQYCADAVFDEQVRFRAVDMTDIPSDLDGFDFCWSACAYEHLGSLEAGLRFVERSLDTLRPGGIAVHTSEFNVTSDDDTFEHCTTSLFRRRDMETLALRLIAEGHSVARIKLDGGALPIDDHVDVPPFANDPHLKMALMRYATTSFGILVRKGGSLT